VETQGRNLEHFLSLSGGRNTETMLQKVYAHILILVINQIDAQNFVFNKFISCLHMFRAHVLIIRRSKLYYTASVLRVPIWLPHYLPYDVTVT